ncbi:MAG: acidic tetraheme cytochrome c3 TmcA [Pseudomonadota bacterium]
MFRRNVNKIFWAIVVLAFCFSLPALSQEDVKTVQDPAFTRHNRPPAVFLHDDHNEKAGIEECGACHHIYKDGVKLADETSEDQKCSDCHLPAGAKDTMPLVGTYHNRCKNCHMAQKKGPVMCGECHRRMD